MGFGLMGMDGPSLKTDSRLQAAALVALGCMVNLGKQRFNPLSLV